MKHKIVFPHKGGQVKFDLAYFCLNASGQGEKFSIDLPNNGGVVNVNLREATYQIDEESAFAPLPEPAPEAPAEDLTAAAKVEESAPAETVAEPAAETAAAPAPKEEKNAKPKKAGK